MKKVYHVTIKDSGKDLYFGSLAAIYDFVGDDELGVKLNTLYCTDLDASQYENRKVTIKKGVLLTKHRN